MCRTFRRRGRGQRSVHVSITNEGGTPFSGFFYTFSFLFVGGERPGAKFVAHEVWACVCSAQDALADEVVEHSQFGAQLTTDELLVSGWHVGVTDCEEGLRSRKNKQFFYTLNYIRVT